MPDPDATISDDGNVNPKSPNDLDPVELFRDHMEKPQADNSRWQAPDPKDLDALFPDFTIVRMLGRGGMGAVYEAVQKSLDRPVAIKVLPTELSQDLEFESRFRREAKSMARLNHSNIIHIHDFGQTAGEEKYFYFVMEFVDGADLHQMIREGHVEEDTALKVIIQICEALQYAHDKGYVHRDIKPANILVTSEGVVKVGDFGLAKLIDPKQGSDTDQQELTITGYSMGTPTYMAPEQLSGKDEIDHRADIYSLGVMLYEMLTGEIPRGAFDPPSGRIQVDVRIDDVVLKAMQDKPDRRYQRARDVETDVELIRTNPRAYTMAALEKKERAKQTAKAQKGWTTGLVGLLVVLLSMAGALLWTKPWERETDIRPVETAADTRQPGQSSRTRSTQPKIELPPTLAEMKKGGGRLHTWMDGNNRGAAKFYDSSKAEPFDDITSLSGGDIGWVATRANGQSVHNVLHEKLKGRIDLRQVVVQFAIDQNDQVVGLNWNQIGGATMLRGVDRVTRASLSPFDPPWGLILTPEQRVRFIGQVSPDVLKEGQLPHLTPQIESLTNVRDVLKRWTQGALLLDDGNVRLFDSEIGVLKASPEAYDIVKISKSWRGRGFYGLRKDGSVIPLIADDAKEHDPGDIPLAYDLVANSQAAAIQKEDGSWHAWGTDRTLIAKINGLGPAVDLHFNAGKGDDGENWSGLLWIKPVNESSQNSDPSSSGNWIELFDGKSLAGWNAEDPGVFEVRDGAIVANGANTTKRKNHHLAYAGLENAVPDWKNFELAMEVRTDPDSNSGVFIHTDSVPSTKDGLEIEITSPAYHEDQKTGSLLRGMKRLTPIRDNHHVDGEWFELKVRVIGDTVSSSVDGREVMRWAQPENERILSGGTITLQCSKHQVWFRNIRLRDLGDGE